MSDEKIGAINDNRDAFDWVLEKQAALRGELMTFYKKDLKEIQTALSSIQENPDGADFTKKALEDVQEYFINQWLRSYNLVTPDNKSTVQPKPNTNTK